MAPASTPHRRLRAAAALAAAGLLQALASMAVQAAPALQDAGTWTLAKDGEGAPACRIKLERRRVIGGSALSAPAGCGKVTPKAEDLYAWYRNAGGELVMADPQRHAVLVFHALPNGVWATEGSDDDRLLLQRVRVR